MKTRKVTTGEYKAVYKDISFSVEYFNGLWSIYFADYKIDDAVFNEYTHNDRAHVLKRIALEKAAHFIDELK